MKIFIARSAIPLSRARQYIKLFKRERYADVFNKYGTGKKGEKYRIHIPLSASGLQQAVIAQAPEEIVTALTAEGYAVSDYSLGLATKTGTARQIKIGKVLKDPELLKKFTNDPQRASSKNVPAWVIISRHPYDIAGMSFDRGWTSCMNIGRYDDQNVGSESWTVDEDIKHGTLVAYLVKSDDKNINNPVSRILIKPYSKRKEYVLAQDPPFGAPNKHFEAIVQKFCDYMNTGAKKGVYYCNGDLYNQRSSTLLYGYAVNEIAKMIYDDRSPSLIHSVNTEELMSVILDLERLKDYRPKGFGWPKDKEEAEHKSKSIREQTVAEAVCERDLDLALITHVFKNYTKYAHLVAANKNAPVDLAIQHVDKDNAREFFENHKDKFTLEHYKIIGASSVNLLRALGVQHADSEEKLLAAAGTNFDPLYADVVFNKFMPPSMVKPGSPLNYHILQNCGNTATLEKVLSSSLASVKAFLLLNKNIPKQWAYDKIDQVTASALWNSPQLLRGDYEFTQYLRSREQRGLEVQVRRK